MSLKDQMAAAGKKYGLGGGGDFFKFEKSGDYRIRVLTPMFELATHFFGKGVPGQICYGDESGCPFHHQDEKSPQVRFICYVLDRTDGKVKMAELPWSVVSVIADYEQDEDWKFESYPMPYDLKIKFDKENKDPKSIYKTIASPDRTPVDGAVLGILSEKIKKLPPDEYVQKRQQKQVEAHLEEGIYQAEQERRQITSEGNASSAAPQKPIQVGTNTILGGVAYPEQPKDGDIPF